MNNADSVHTNDRNSLDRHAPHWAGPLADTDHRRQHSVLALLNAAP